DGTVPDVEHALDDPAPAPRDAVVSPLASKAVGRAGQNPLLDDHLQRPRTWTSTRKLRLATTFSRRRKSPRRGGRRGDRGARAARATATTATPAAAPPAAATARGPTSRPQISIVRPSARTGSGRTGSASITSSVSCSSSAIALILKAGQDPPIWFPRKL